MARGAGQADRLAVLVGQREGRCGRVDALGVPSSASVRIGSALRFTEAVAIGAAPTSTMASAATRSRPSGGDSPASAWSHHPPGAAVRADSARRPPRPAPAGAGAASSATWPGNREADDGQIAAHEEERHGKHGVGVGADAAEEAEVLDEHPVGEAEPTNATRPPAPDGAVPVTAVPRWRRARARRQVHPPSVGLVERGERPHPRREEVRLGRLRHLLHHAGGCRRDPASTRVRARPAGRPSREERAADPTMMRPSRAVANACSGKRDRTPATQ